MGSARKLSLLSIMGPGILVAATGVGAGDLATAALTGSKLGVAVLWAVLLGAFMKFALTEGLARWQLATGNTLLEGARLHLGRTVPCLFLLYFLVWSFLVAAALMSACGVATFAILPLFDDAATGKIVYGIILSLITAVLVRVGGYRLFEKVMTVCIGLMFATTVLTAALLAPGWTELLAGVFRPSVPDLQGDGLGWTIALIGGVGGSVTILCYGYWIREEGRVGAEEVGVCRIDLAAGYAMTALFGMAMVVIGSTIQVEGSGATLVVDLADRLVSTLGPVGRWIFLLGAWSAVFSSMLGVWQSVPYLFANLWNLMGKEEVAPGQIINVSSAPYRWYLYALATLPMAGLWVGFAHMQKLYAVLGAVFVPLLALLLLILNGGARWVGSAHKNHPATSALLGFVLLFFLAAAWLSFA